MLPEQAPEEVTLNKECSVYVCMYVIELCTLCSYMGVLTLTKNEVMTGSVGASNAPFSRFTLALYEDSG